MPRARPPSAATISPNFSCTRRHRRYSGAADLRLPNLSNATRARIIDDWLRDRLLADPEQLVIILGEGFDARAFRLPGGRWVEIDQPGLPEATVNCALAHDIGKNRRRPTINLQ